MNPPRVVASAEGFRVNVQWQMCLAVWRHTRFGWLVMAFLYASTLLMMLFFSGTAGAASRRELAVNVAVVLVLLFPALLAFAAASLLASGWKNLLRSESWRMAPGGVRAVRLAALTQWGMLLLLAILPTLIFAASAYMASPIGPAWWAWLLAACGMPALGIALGTAVQLLFSMAGLALLFPAGWFMASSTNKGVALQAAAEAVGGLQTVLSVFGFAGLLSLYWVVHQSHHKWIATLGRRPSAGVAGAPWVGAIGTPSAPTGWRGLWLPQQSQFNAWRAVAASLVFSLVTLVAINPASLPWSGYVAPLLATLAYMHGASGYADAWASPRLQLLPGGLQRSHGAAALLGLTLRQPGTLCLAASAILWLLLTAALWQPPWHQWASCVAVTVAAWAFGACTAVATLAYVRTGLGRTLVMLATPLPLAIGLALLVHFDWPVAPDHPSAWPAYSAVLVAGAIGLAAAIWIGSRRAWRGIDWGKQPALPAFGRLQAAKVPKRSSAR